MKRPKNTGLFYAGYGAVLTPSFGIRAAYGDDVAQYNNALGFFVLCTFPAVGLKSSLSPGSAG